MAELDHRLVQAHDYVMVNPLQVERSWYEDLNVLPIVPAPFKNQPGLFPLLVNLSALEFSRRVALVEQSERWLHYHDGPMLSALLQSEASPERVVAHLAQVIHVHRDGRDRVFRFYDPRVFRHLTWLLDAGQMNGLLGPIKAWTWATSNGDWQSQAQSVDVAASRRLHADQWAFIARMEDINLSIQNLADMTPGLAATEEQARRLDKAMTEAKQDYGLSEPDDYRLYAEQTYRYHPRIHRHPVLLAKLELARAGKSTYLGACADLGHAAMLQLVAELDAGPRERS